MIEKVCDNCGMPFKAERSSRKFCSLNCAAKKLRSEGIGSCLKKGHKINVGRALTYQHKNNIRQALKGRKHTEESKIKMSMALSGKPKSVEHIENLKKAQIKFYSNPNNRLGRNTGSHWKLSQETRLKQSLARLGTHPSAETRLKLKIARSKRRMPFRDTRPEIILQKALRDLGIDYTAHKPIRLSTGSYHQADIFIKPNIIIEADGDYWHNLSHVKSRDSLVNKEISNKGYVIYRFWEHEIYNKNIRNLEKSVI